MRWRRIADYIRLVERGKKVEAGVEAGLMLLVCTQHAVICEFNQANRCNLFVMLSERMRTSTQRPSIVPTNLNTCRNFFWP